VAGKVLVSNTETQYEPNLIALELIINNIPPSNDDPHAICDDPKIPLSLWYLNTISIVKSPVPKSIPGEAVKYLELEKVIALFTALVVSAVESPLAGSIAIKVLKSKIIGKKEAKYFLSVFFLPTKRNIFTSFNFSF
jgi:hypothetical protein